MSRHALFLLLLALPARPIVAKDKNTLPEWILEAHTVRVVVSPDAANSLNHPMANSDAQQAVRRALADWGRFTLAEGQETDLVISVRAGGKVVSSTLETGPADTREEVRPGNGNVRIFGQQGRSPAIADPTADPKRTNPHLGKQIGRVDDVFEVFRGGVAYSAKSTPIWQYAAKDALKAPNVAAVEQFRKAIAAAEQHRAQHRKP
jgi:hypothetical protein